ncbi:MAG: ABC transporter substrate-binding protein, partial [Kiritimatiellae bacterium]|nr:ABC transporter substrate-binding protein [Kiritimatiellia bacterium]
VAALYTEKTGVPCKVVTAASGTYEQTLISELDKSAPPTLFVIGNQQGVVKYGDYALDLSGTPIVGELNTDAYNLYDENGKLVSVGYAYESFGIIVNVDLLEKAGHKLDEIKNFDTLKAVAEDIHARAGELGFDAFTSSGMDDSSSWRFTGHLANVDLFYESRDAGGWTEAPSTISGQYLQNFKNLWDLYINNSAYAPGTLATGGYDAEGEFGRGEAVFYQNGSWEWSALTETYGLTNLQMIPFYSGVAGEEKAGLNSGTENCWAVNATASEADQQATLDFMYWCVTDPEASALLVGTFAAMPYKQAVESTNGFLADANEYANDGCYTMTWAFNYEPNVDTFRAGLVAAMNQYDANPSDAAWATVETAFVQGWAAQWQAIYG